MPLSGGSIAGVGGGVAGFAAGCPLLPFGGGMRTRSAGFISPRNSAIVGNATMILPAQLSQVSPKAPRIVRLLTATSAAMKEGCERLPA